MLHDLINNRALSAKCRRNIQQRVYDNTSLWQRLKLECLPEKHSGCVNSVTWNTTGTLLVSGSDDTKICIWEYGPKQLRTCFESGHSSNIFCTKFMPGTSDTVIASCARDGEIRLHTLAEGRDTLANPSRVISCHQDSVNKLATSAYCPFLLWSVSDDRTVRMFDLRMKLSSDDPRAHIIARFQCSSMFFNEKREKNSVIMFLGRTGIED